jgi:hypothetical protein
VLPTRLTTARGILWLPSSSASTLGGRKGTVKFATDGDADGDGDGGFSELGADGVRSDLL